MAEVWVFKWGAELMPPADPDEALAGLLLSAVHGKQTMWATTLALVSGTPAEASTLSLLHAVQAEP